MLQVFDVGIGASWSNSRPSERPGPGELLPLSSVSMLNPGTSNPASWSRSHIASSVDRSGTYFTLDFDHFLELKLKYKRLWAK